MTSQTNVSLTPSNEVHLAPEMLSTSSTLTSTLVSIPTTITSTATLSPNIVPIASTVTASPPQNAAGGILVPKNATNFRPQTVILQSRPSSSPPVRGLVNPSTIRS